MAVIRKIRISCRAYSPSGAARSPVAMIFTCFYGTLAHAAHQFSNDTSHFDDITINGQAPMTTRFWRTSAIDARRASRVKHTRPQYHDRCRVARRTRQVAAMHFAQAKPRAKLKKSTGTGDALPAPVYLAPPARSSGHERSCGTRMRQHAVVPTLD